MKLTDQQQRALADRLFQVVLADQGIAPLSNALEYDFDDASLIRRKQVNHLIAACGKPKGHKIGFTALVRQQMYGMTGPDFGIHLDTMVTPQSRPDRVSHLSNSKAEPELAFELSHPPEGPGLTVAEVLAAAGRILAAVEVSDSRVGAMKAWANDPLADNAVAGWVILGSRPLPPVEVDFAALTLSMDVDKTAQSAAACDVMGHPAAPLAFLAVKLAALNGLGGHLKAGDVVITGAPLRSVEVRFGSRLHAEFGPLGTIDPTFA